MTIPRMARTMAQLWQQGIRSAQRLNERTHGWLGMLADAARETLKPDSAITAAAIAYFAIFSLFPLTLLSIAIASFYLGPLMDQQLIVQKLEFIAPALGQLLGKNIDRDHPGAWASHHCCFGWPDLVCLHDFLHAYRHPEWNLGQ